MLLKRISYRIALQFTAFVFVLLLINGAIFLVADIGNAQRQSHLRLQRQSNMIVQHVSSDVEDFLSSIPSPLRDRVRIVNALGQPQYAGAFFNDIPFTIDDEYADRAMQSDDYVIVTEPIIHSGQLIGFVQLADVDRLQWGDLPLRAALYLLVSIAISALTFFVGLFFAKSSLRPAEESMQRLEQFTQDASHELRTPLAVLGSSLDVALKSKKYKEGIESAKDDLKQISVLVERLLELARLDSFGIEKESLDFSGLVAESTEKFRPLADKASIQINTHIAPGIRVIGDETLLRQVMNNVLNNAVKFTNTGGTVTVTLTKRALIMTDTGIGMSPDDLLHIFDRFYQADDSRSRGGFGLGLALVKRICDLHGWTIDVKSEAGKGSTFRLTFS